VGGRKLNEMRSACKAWVLAMLATLAGCASVDFDYPRIESSALPVAETSDTHLGRQTRDIVAEHPGKAGFYPVNGGIDSLALRLLLAERAERTIDAQYFLIHDDIVGRVFVNALLRAANRGVRVRFLLDDILSQGLDPGLAALDSHPNIEVRIFNPFAHRGVRALDIASVGRLTRRMHNKSMTVDNQVTLIGGRNIAAEYFDARPRGNFSDLDVLAIGPVVPEVSNMFDTYWSHRVSMPISALADAPDDAEERLASLEEKVRRSLESAANSEYAEAARASVLRYIETDASAFVWAPYDLVFDSPDKSSGKTADEAQNITTGMRASLGTIEESLFVVTPYFVLAKDEIESFRALRERGVEVTVLTNGLASNNHTSSHSGYMPVRKPLLKQGVELYEMRANLDESADNKLPKGAVVSTLHAKAFAVDGKSVFIGSFNWNQRSVNRDTELGVIIHSPELVNAMVERVKRAMPERSFRVSLNESNDLRWTVLENGREVVVKKEPQTGFWKRFGAGFMRILPIKSQL